MVSMKIAKAKTLPQRSIITRTSQGLILMNMMEILRTLSKLKNLIRTTMINLNIAMVTVSMLRRVKKVLIPTGMGMLMRRKRVKSILMVTPINQKNIPMNRKAIVTGILINPKNNTLMVMDTGMLRRKKAILTATVMDMDMGMIMVMKTKTRIMIMTTAILLFRWLMGTEEPSMIGCELVSLLLKFKKSLAFSEELNSLKIEICKPSKS